MDSNEIKNNGWNEYKLLVLKQLEFLAAQIVDLTKSLVTVDKEQAKSELKIDDIKRNNEVNNMMLDKRLDSMNEFREALKDQTSKYLTKDEYILMHERVINDIKSLQEQSTKSLSREEFTNLHDKVNEDVRMLREHKSNLEGKASTSSVYIAYIAAAIAIILSILQFFIK